jgi:ferrochelatase
VREIQAETIVVDGIAFIHEQSETLAELDHDLRADAEARGLRYFRVPTPHDDPRLAIVLADLVEPLLTDRSSEAGLRPCRCRERPGVYCLDRT